MLVRVDIVPLPEGTLDLGLSKTSSLPSCFSSISQVWGTFPLSVSVSGIQSTLYARDTRSLSSGTFACIPLPAAGFRTQDSASPGSQIGEAPVALVELQELSLRVWAIGERDNLSVAKDA